MDIENSPFKTNLLYNEETYNMLSKSYNSKYKELFYNFYDKNDDVKKLAESYLFWFDRLPRKEYDPKYKSKYFICINGMILPIF